MYTISPDGADQTTGMHAEQRKALDARAASQWIGMIETRRVRCNHGVVPGKALDPRQPHAQVLQWLVQQDQYRPTAGMALVHMRLGRYRRTAARSCLPLPSGHQ